MWSTIYKSYNDVKTVEATQSKEMRWWSQVINSRGVEMVMTYKKGTIMLFSYRTRGKP